MAEDGRMVKALARAERTILEIGRAIGREDGARAVKPVNARSAGAKRAWRTRRNKVKARTAAAAQ